MTLPSLETVLKYENNPVVNRFKREYPHSADQAENIFKNLLKFFWASKKHANELHQSPADSSLNFSFIMDEEMKNIDLMWHIFLLYTQDYEFFCKQYFGEFLHHLPDLVPDHFEKDFNFDLNLEKFLVYVEKNLGEQTLLEWFHDSALN